MKSAIDAAHKSYIQRKEQERKERLASLAEQAKVYPPAKVNPKEKRASVKKDRLAYKRLVWRLTKAQDLSQVPNIHLREWRVYDIDHIISIWDGFRLGLPAETIASVSNLRIIPHEQNIAKSSRSDFDAHPLGGLLIAKR